MGTAKKFALACAAVIGASAVAVGAEDAVRGWKPGELQLHCIHTGSGEANFFIFPDATTMLLDCGDIVPRGNPNDSVVPEFPDSSASPGERIARYILSVNPAKDPAWVDWLVVSHYHSDHIGWMRGTENEPPRGFAAAAQKLHFRRAVDRGRPGVDCPKVEDDKDELALLEKLYSDLKARDGLAYERFEVGRRNQLRPLNGEVSDFSVFNLCAGGFVADERTGSVTNLCAGFTSGVSENAMSLGFILRYGDFSLYMAGDFSGHVRRAAGDPEIDLEVLFAPFVPAVSAAHVNHHGHYTMPSELVSALRARAWFGSTWTLRQFIPPVMERLADRSLYPGERAICPPFIPAERLAEAQKSGAAWLKDVPPAAYKGAHVVFIVPPGGRTFDIECRSADGKTTFRRTLASR